MCAPLSSPERSVLELLVRPLPLLALLAHLALLTACGGGEGGRSKGRAYYETTLIKTPPSDAKELSALQSSLPKQLKGRKVVVVEGGKERAVPPAQLSKLPHHLLRALWIASGKELFGAELDLKVRTPQGTTPVTVWVGAGGDLRAQAGAWPSRATPSSPEEVERRWGVRVDAKDRGWSARALRALDVALSLLSPEELALMRDVPFFREKRGDSKRKAALYTQGADCAGRVTLYDTAVTAQSDQFIGDVGVSAKIYPVTAMALLHEVGHAVHNAPGRRAQCAYLKAVEERNALAQRANAAKGAENARLIKEVGARDERLKSLERQMKLNMKRGPALSAYLKARGKGRAPTTYGETSGEESFAESFALFRADPKALKRALPSAHKWFSSGAHIKEMSK